MQNHRCRIIYVCNSRVFGSEAHNKFIAGLRERYEVDTARDMSRNVADMILGARNKRPYDGVVSHVPYHPYTYSYRGGKDILRELCTELDIPVIAYTGAGDHRTLLSLESCVDQCTGKTNNPEQDAVGVERNLENMWQRLDDIIHKTPTVIRQEEKTIIDGNIHYPHALGVIGGVAIAKSCLEYSGAVLASHVPSAKKRNRFFSRAKARESVDAKDIMDFMMLFTEADLSLRFTISGIDAEAEQLAERLGNILLKRSSVAISAEDYE